MAKDTIIADSVYMGMNLKIDVLEEYENMKYGSGNSNMNRMELSLEEVAILFAAHHNKKFIPIKLLDKTYLVKMGSAFDSGSDSNKRQLEPGSYKEIMKEVKSYWLKDADRYISSAPKHTRKTSGDEKSIKRTIDIYQKDKSGKKYRGQLNYYIQRGDFEGRNGKVFFLNIQGSPSKILTGDNVSPMFTSNDPDEKADIFTELFSLPARVILQIMMHYVRSGYNNLALYKQFELDAINIHRIQLAAYSPPFYNSSSRNTGMRLLYNVYNKKMIRESRGVMIADSLGLSLESDDSVISRDEFGNPTGISGFLVKRRYGGDPYVSLGFYGKNLEKKQNNSPDLDTTRKGFELYLENSIRLDLTVHSEGLRRLYNSGSDITGGPITQKHVRQFLTKVFQEDINANGLFLKVLTESLKLDQLFAVTYRQWNKAFRIIENEGYEKLVADLKQRSTDKPSWMNLCRKHQVPNPSRLKSLIFEKTQAVKKVDISLPNNKSKQIELAIPGVDITIPYLLFLEAKNTAADTYIDPETMAEMLNDNTILRNSSIFEFKEAAKQAMIDGRMIYRLLLANGLEKVKTVGSVEKE